MDFVIIGCGRVFDYYRSSILTKLPESWNLVGLVENNTKKIEYLKEDFKDLIIVDSIDKLLNSIKIIDLAIVLSISGMHYSHSKKLLENNINVIVEKPICMIPSEIEEIHQIAKKKNKKIFSIFQNRFNKALILTKKFVEEGKLGEIRTSRVCLRWCRDENYFCDSWRGTWKNDGGVINNQAIHHLDAYQWIMGMPNRVFTINKTNYQKIEAEDTSMSLFVFENGSLGSFEATTLAPKKDIEACMDLIGSKGYIKLGGISLNKVLDIDVVNKKDLIKENSEEFESGYGNGHQKTFKEIINCIEYGLEYSIDLLSVKNTSKLVNAMYLSSKLSKTVNPNEEIEYTGLGRIN